MDVLIRKSTELDGVSTRDTDLAVEATKISIGSDADAGLVLRGTGIAQDHAAITSRGDKFRIDCSRGSTVDVNGVIGKRFELVEGDVVGIGNHRLQILAPPAGFDLGIAVRESSSGSDLHAGAYRTDLSQTRLGSRKIAWLGSVLLFTATLILPLMHYYDRQQDSVPSGIAQYIPFSDAIWTSGPLDDSHASLSNQCGACHQKLFQAVKNEACSECHNDVQDHIRWEEQTVHTEVFINGQCVSCHQEHNEPRSTLVVENNALCADCHAESDIQTLDADLRTVSGFAADQHPEFSVTVFSPLAASDKDGNKAWSEARLPIDKASENSGLMFNHAVHLDSENVITTEGETLGCGNCHQLNKDGEHFRKISFETDCATGCHDLELDDRNQLPHALPEIAIAAIEGYYLKKFGNPDAPLPGRLGLKLRYRPDRETDVPDQCKEGSYACAMYLSKQKVEKLFQTSGCINCHIVKSREGEGYDIAAVRLNTDYHPAASFDHESHRLLVKNASGQVISGDDACQNCHSASFSTDSTEVLMPSITRCTECHNGQAGSPNVPLGCTQCHVYHPDVSLQ